MSRTPRAASGLLVLLLLAAAPGGASLARPEGREAGPKLRLAFDAQVPGEFLRLVEGRIIDDDSLEAWLDLPGNAELLRQGALRGELDREELRENLWHSILGHYGKRGEGLGTLDFEPISDLKRMMVELAGRQESIARRVAEHLEAYLPDGSPQVTAQVRLHLGGTWDGRTQEDIFLNLTFLHEFGSPWFAGIEGLLAHEATHLIHRRLDVLPEDAATPPGLFAVALTQIHSEGLARQVEMGLLAGEHPTDTYAAWVTNRYHNGLAGFSSSFRRVEELRETCLRRQDSPGCLRLIRAGLARGGATYVVGQGMARAIERAFGRKALGGTLVTGPAEFFRFYAAAARMDKGLPAPGEGLDEDLAAASAHLAGRREIWRLRKEAREAHHGGDYARAADLLTRLADREPGDPIDAYNLACALARKGESGAALEWLGKSIALGYKDRAHMEADPDLASLRDARDYRRLVEGLAGGAAPASTP